MNKKRCNSEGYFDPTACDALSRIEKKEKRLDYKPLIFICSPYAGDTEQNVKKALEYCRFAVSKNYIPLAPHLYFPQFMDDSDPDQRNLGIFFGLVLQSQCHEVWVFGSMITKGMTFELEKAFKRHIPIRFFTEQCVEVSVQRFSKP